MCAYRWVFNAKDIRTLPTIAVMMPMKEFHCSLPYGGTQLVLVGAGASLVAVAGPAATPVGGTIMAEGAPRAHCKGFYGGNVHRRKDGESFM